MNLNEAELEGRIFGFIENIIKLRPFKVKINEFISDTKTQTGGIPQRSVVRAKFSILEINKIVTQLPIDNRFQI